MFGVALNAEIFFDLLPKDWKDGIVPFWKSYKKKAKIYLLKKDGEICAGGIVFSTIPPEMQHFKKEAEFWLKQEYLYIGFVWVPEDKRKRNYGSEWLLKLKNQNNNQKFWLTTEEKPLKDFYIRNGFRYVKTLLYKGTEEDLFVFESIKSN